MFDRVLNTPLISNLVFSLLGHYVEQNYWRGMRPYYKGFRGTIERTKKNFFLAARVINIFFICQREKQKHYFFWPQIKFQNCALHLNLLKDHQYSIQNATEWMAGSGKYSTGDRLQNNRGFSKTRYRKQPTSTPCVSFCS